MPAEIGEPAPDFTLLDQNRQPVSLADLQGRKSLIVFIPFPFTSTCEGELCAIRDNLGDLAALDASVVAISCDTLPVHKRWAAEQGFDFPILSDFWPHGATADAYGCFNDQLGCAMRTTYVLDEEGVVREIISSAGLGEVRDIADYRAALAGL